MSDGLFDQFKDWYEKRHDYARAWKARTGGQVVATMCTYTAEELLIAAGMLPVRVLGAHEPQNVTEPHIFGMFCPFCRDSLAQGLLGRFDYAEGVTLTQSCIQYRQTFSSWRSNVPSVKWDYYVPMPNDVQSPHARKAHYAEIQAFRTFLSALTGKEPPAIVATKVLNGPADWSFASSKGKVVVVDFWATWCPPCRGVIPDLVAMQEKHGSEGLQVVGVTRFYGYGMDFAADSKLPNGGKNVGDRTDPAKKLSEADELKVNENFVAAFKLNYPVVFTDASVAKDAYGVTGIPTVYVIGRDGKVVGHVVGGGKESHEKLEEMVKSALAAGAADAAGTKKGD